MNYFYNVNCKTDHSSRGDLDLPYHIHKEITDSAETMQNSNMGKK